MLDIHSTVKLNSGHEMPLLGLGVFQMDDAACERSVREALDVGYRLVDTATVYGNERGVGAGLAGSRIPREQLFVTTEDLIAYGRRKGIQPEAYSPLAQARKMDAPTLKEIAAAHGKTVAQVMIRWQLQQGVVVIPKSSKPARIRENAAVYDVVLPADEIARIDALNEDHHTIAWKPEPGWF